MGTRSCGQSIFWILWSTFRNFDDAKANVNDIVNLHWVACCALVGCADEEARREGLKTVRGMPVGGHSLPILFAIFGRCLAVLLDEPVEHVQKDCVWLFHTDWLIRFTNCFWEICEENIG